jgi:hypothetical protein
MEVPTPTMAAPITKSETLNFLAKDTEPATRKSAPKTMPTKDTIRIIYSIIIFNLIQLSIFSVHNKYPNNHNFHQFESHADGWDKIGRKAK